MRDKPVIFEDLDISVRLRMLMASEKLTVAELAAMAGVSKSAMEKYLSGPSSPRATALASLAANLGLSLEWLLFGYSENDRVRIRNLSMSAMFQLLHDLKSPGEIRATFNALEVGSKEFNSFAIDLATDRAEELGERLWNARKQAMKNAASGFQEATLDPVDLPTPGNLTDEA